MYAAAVSASTELAKAREALADGAEDVALDALIAAWRDTRGTEIAELVEQLSKRLESHLPKLSGKLEVFQEQWLAIANRKRTVDLPTLLDSILHTTDRSGNAIVEALAHRGKALTVWAADPRTSSRVAGYLNATSFGAMSKSNQPFWRAMFQLVVDHDDPRAIDTFAKIDFDRMFRGWNTVAERIAFFQTAVDETIAKLRARHPKGSPPLSKPLAKDVAAIRKAIAALAPITPELAARLGSQPAADKKPTRPKPSTKTAHDPAAAGAPLAAAERALGNGDDEAALAALLDAWRACRSPQIAGLVERISTRLEARLPQITGEKRADIQAAWLAVAKQQRPADLPRLLASLTNTFWRSTDAAARLRAIDRWPLDPRAASGAIRNLETIPFHATSTKPFWQALIEFAAFHGDLRTAEALESLATRMDKILRSQYTDLSAIRRWFAKQMTAAAVEIRTRNELPLDREMSAACDRIAKKIATSTDPGERLFAEICARPDDDQPRLVYADYLQERHDPRGELIALQLSGTDLERQEKLIAAHAKTWLGPVAPIAWIEGTHFDRGFPSEIWLNDARNVDAVERVVGHSVWATVRRLHLVGFPKLPTELLRHPTLRSLRHLSVHEEPMVELMSWDKVPYTSLGLDDKFSAANRRTILDGAAKLSALRAIEFDGSYFESSDHLRWLLDSSIGKHLERLVVSCESAGLENWIALATKLPLSSFRFGDRVTWAGWLDFTRDSKRRLSIAHAHIGGGRPYRASNELTFTALANHLANLPAGSLTRLRVTGRPPSPSDRSLIDTVCTRFPGIALDVPATADAPATKRRKRA